MYAPALEFLVQCIFKFQGAGGRDRYNIIYTHYMYIMCIHIYYIV